MSRANRKGRGPVTALAGQDGVCRYLGIAGFALMLTLRHAKGFRAALLAAGVCILVWSYALTGVIESHAVLAICLLLILAFSAPFRGARPSWQRRAASIHALRHDHRKTEISKT